MALFTTEFTKVLFWALAWAINYRTAIRLKVAVSTLVFENLVSFKTLTHISVGEVSWSRRNLILEHKIPSFLSMYEMCFWDGTSASLLFVNVLPITSHLPATCSGRASKHKKRSSRHGAVVNQPD